MRRCFFLLGSFVFMASCGPSNEDLLAQATQRLDNSKAMLPSLETACRYGPPESADEVRERSLAEWDAIAGENVANISPNQEWEIRRSLGREMGLAPSEVNGWRQIYEARATRARETLARRERESAMREEERERGRQDACLRAESVRQSIALETEAIARLRAP